jgi:carbon-monoxide dehydrogenase large subunit
MSRPPSPVSFLDRPNSYIGRSVPRPNARRLLQGRGRYTDDLSLPRTAHVAFLRSAYAHARIASIDAETARAAPGVIHVATGADIARVCKPWVGVLTHFSGMRSPPQYPLAVDRVLWRGEPLVAVVAETRAAAEDATELVSVEFEELAAVADMETALDPQTPVIHPELGDNKAFGLHLEKGDVDAALASAHAVVEVDLRFGRHTAVTLEPRTILADYDPSEARLTVYQSTQTPYQMQDVYARHLGLSHVQVRVIARDIGGSFGMKLHVYGDEVATAALSIVLRRPIKFTADRLESFIMDIHSRDHRVTAKMGVSAQGEITGMAVQDLTGVGPYSAYPRTSAVEGSQVVRLMGGPYQLANYRGDLTVVFQNKTMMSQYRAVGHPIACAATEALMDRAAEAVGLDPIEIRRRNFITADMYPHTSPTGFVFERLSHHECLDGIVALMKYQALRAEQAELRSRGIHRGIGIATFIEITNPGPTFYGAGGAKITAQDGCILKLEPSGQVRCLVSVGEQGQGTEAVMAQICASALGVSMDDVTVITGDSETTPHGGANWGSRGVGIGGETVLITARELRNNLLSLAAAILQARAEELDIIDGKIVDGKSGREHMALAELARIAYFRQDTLPPDFQPELTVARHHVPRGLPFAFTNGVQASYVEVNVETGFVQLLGHWVVEDCGRMINPLLVDEQIRGGVVQGLGSALFEECVYSPEGQLQNGSMADYLVPMSAEMPDIVVGHVSTPTKTSELGAKGVGEAGTAGAAAAVLNAVNDALRPLGARVNATPITPDRVLRAVGRI